jgi:hypothetical protein
MNASRKIIRGCERLEMMVVITVRPAVIVSFRSFRLFSRIIGVGG